MRRKDKQITSRADIDAIIRGSQVCHLAFAVDNEPYVVPISFGYDGEAFYFHTANKGKKLDCIDANPRVCFQFERDVQLVTDVVDACKWTVEYESVIGWGAVAEALTDDDKIHGLNQIMLQYSGKSWTFGARMLENTRVWRLDVESVTGKRFKQKTP